MHAASFSSLFESHRDQLTAVEQRLVHALTANPTAASFLSGRELAQTAGVHESSAVRLAQKLGFDGYPAFRRALQRCQEQPVGSALRVARTLSAARDESLFKVLLGKEIESLLACEQHVSQAQIQAASDMVAAGDRVFIWAAGNSKVLADLLDRRLRRAGFSAENIAHEGRELAEHLVLLKPGDVVVAFAFRRAPAGLSAVLKHARRVGARSLLIADMLGHTLKTRPDLMLAAPRGEDEEFLTQTVPMLITNALVLTLARGDHGRSIAGLQALDRLREDLELRD